MLNPFTRKLRTVLPAVLFLLALACGAPSGLALPDQPVTLSQPETASPSRFVEKSFLMQHIHVLASDTLEGRGTGQPGSRRAARYLEQYYRSLSASRKDPVTLMRQPFTLEGVFWDAVTYEVYRTDEADTLFLARSRLEKGTEALFYPLKGGAREYDGPVVFAGNGWFGQSDRVSISEPGIVQDSWALVFEPAADSPSRDELISALTRDHGALGVIFIPVTDADTWEDKAADMSRQLERLRMLRLPDGRTRMAGPTRGVAVSIHPGLAPQLLGLTGPEQLDSLRHLWDHGGDGLERFQTGYRFRNRPELATRSFEEDNIIAVIPGSDAQRANEMVVLTAHYDHMGLGEPDYRDDIVYSGADDNASGTAVLMQVARAFEKAALDGYHPSRTLVFLHLAAEEWGLIGARHFIRNNPFEEYDITANINVDMVGYVDNVYSGKDQDYVYVIGAGMVSTRLEELLRQANNATSELLLDDTYNNTSHRLQLYRRSDHWVFAEQDIPFVFFFSGLHDYYHGPSDTADRINGRLLASRARLITELVWYLAETPVRPESDRKKLGSGRVPSR